MGTIVLFIIFMLLAVALFLAAPKVSDKMIKLGMRLGGAAVAVIAVLSMAFATVVQVPTREYGVVTTFGKPTGMFTNGLHLKAPWQKVTTMDATIQTDNYTGNDHCIKVRIAHQATACVDASIRWRIKPSAVDSLFQNYRGSTDTVRNSLVVRQLSSSLNDSFSAYDALAIDDKGNSASGSLTPIAEAVTKSMKEKIGDQIEILSVIVPVVHYDENTQSKVNALLAQVAETRIAEQGIKTSKAQAEANRTLATSVSKDPNVLVSKCLDDLATGKFTAPAGFSCWPSSGSSVVIPSAGAEAKK